MRSRILGRYQPPETIDEQYFYKVRPELYKNHTGHAQHGSRQGRSLAEHLDSACQFVLTVSKIAQVPDDKRAIILAATAVHDLNKLDPKERNVKTLARDRDFLKAQLERAGVADWVKTDEDLDLVRRLIERHSGHNASDGMRFLPEDPNIKRWAAMLIGGDLYDLGIPEEQRIRKVETELTVALQKDTHLFKVGLSEDRGYLTALLLAACEEVLYERGLATLSIDPDGQLFMGECFPEEDLMIEIAQKWHRKINQVFSGNVEQLVKASKDGIKVDPKAVQQNPDAAIEQVDALLVKKFSGYKADKIAQDVQKYGGEAGAVVVAAAAELGLIPISNAEDFAISEGLKAAYLSYREADLSPKDAWDRIAEQVELTPDQRIALEPFNAQYGRCLFAAKAVPQGQAAIAPLLRDSFQLRQTEDTSIPQELVAAVAQLLNFAHPSTWQGFSELTSYIEANPRLRCSLGPTSTAQVEELISAKMPPETKVQSFSNRLPGGMSAEPKRRGDALSALGYQLLTVGANFPKASKQAPLYLHFALPKGSSNEMKIHWIKQLNQIAQHHEFGPVTIDELKLYQNQEIIFKPNKVVGLALPRRPEFIHSTVTIPIVWGDVNNSVALIKSLWLGLEISLALDVSFPLILSANLEIQPSWEVFGRVEGIPSTLQPLLGSGQYLRDGHLPEEERLSVVTVERVLERLRCLGQLSVAVASLPKKDDCLYDLARSARRPLEFYHVLLRWLLREQENPNLEAAWIRIKEPLTQLLESLMSEEHDRISSYLKEAAKLAVSSDLKGNSFRRTAKVEPFSEFIKSVRSRKPYMDWDTIFAALVQNYHKRLSRIKDYKIGNKKHGEIKQFYEILRHLFDEVYDSRSERLLADGKTLEAAYLFFWEEAHTERKNPTQT
ncbi:CRISPR-associated protein Csc3 [Phormidium sp. FACHB-1136]|uniref:CRISPR-associated protein Csc3 n=1 Tax=Phormidium sp. FACHB-1136 TaxID=2692848 RepID=UPI001685E599|nr:CRISPR-associated protein Csc3 [Phormidium sp. FACHB-1136]MBD2427717.1 CRISPR-associated protein Csc3 [Phormidium sp. FACHB-1136]